MTLNPWEKERNTMRLNLWSACAFVALACVCLNSSAQAAGLLSRIQGAVVAGQSQIPQEELLPLQGPEMFTPVAPTAVKYRKLTSTTVATTNVTTVMSSPSCNTCAPVCQPCCPPPPVEMTIELCHPCTGCPVCVTLCVPACCAAECPEKCYRHTIIGVGQYTLHWPCCGHTARVRFFRDGHYNVRD